MPAKSRRLTSRLAVIVVMATAVLAPATPAAAIPLCRHQYQCTYTWYETAAKERVVGGMTVFCDGTTDQFGQGSSHLSFTTVQCSTPTSDR